MRPAQTPRLELEEIVSTYEEGAQRLIALDGLSLKVAEAEFVALVGPSGSGKSTLLDIVAGLITQDSGAVRLDGQLTTAEQRLGQSAYMQQRDLLLPWRTTIGNAALGLEASGMSRSDAEQRAIRELWRFGLDGFGDAYPAQLSGGIPAHDPTA
jgi:ABC-type nitrate/sulfonate/bicarbonate transport system ATPase subunit